MATYYVAPTGSDSNPGTLAQPFLTIQKGADVVSPGDFVMVARGDYTSTGEGCTDIPTIVCVTNGGSPGNWVTFKSIEKWGARLTGSDLGFRTQNNASYIVFDGFDMDGIGLVDDGQGAAAFIFNDEFGSNYLVKNCHIHNIGRVCTNSDFGRVGIFTGCPHTTIDSNTFHDIGRYASGEHGCTTTIPRNHDHGVYTDASGPGSQQANFLQITNNVFYDIVNGWCVQVAKGAKPYTDILLADNTCDGANPTRQGHFLFIEITVISNLTVQNNIFNNPNFGAINFADGTYINALVKANLVNGGVLEITPPTTGLTTTGNATGDPLFVDPSTQNYRVSLGSPAIPLGDGLSAVPFDIVGVPRPTSGVCTAGAYEFVAAGVTGTGSSAVKGPTTLGTGKATVTGSGTSGVKGPTTSGLGPGVTVTGDGASAVRGPTTLGTGLSTVTGDGASSVLGPTTFGIGDAVPVTGSGASAVLGPTTLGSGLSTVTGDGLSSVLGPTSLGLGLSTVTGDGASSVLGPTTDGDGLTGYNVTPPDPNAGFSNQPFGATVVASGGVAPYTYSISSGVLPPGLSINASNGNITGTPSTPGTFPFTIQAVDADSNVVQQPASILIATGPPPQGNCPEQDAQVGVPYSSSVQGSGGTHFTITSGQLPPGLVLDAGTGAITGTPLTAGDYAFTISVTG